MYYHLIIFLISIVAIVFFTFLIKKIAIKFNVIDYPTGLKKIHKKPTPLLGGVAIFLSFFIVLYFVRNKLLVGDIEVRHWLGFFIGACFLMIGGFLDDKYNLKPKYQIIWPILAIFFLILGGVSIEKITNPLGGFFYLGGLSGIFIFLWLMGMMYTTKLLDGIDGLVTGITAIGGIIIFLFTITTKYYQPDIGLAALIFSGACLGFLIFNWHPAKIFLGEGGSLLLGYILGVLAIISGGKIAIALLVMGIPVLDVLWTIIRRLVSGKNPFKFADRKHLHFRFLDLGMGQRKTAFIFYILSAAFGISGLFLQSIGKALALLILFTIMLLFVIGFSFLDKKKV